MDHSTAVARGESLVTLKRSPSLLEILAGTSASRGHGCATLRCQLILERTTVLQVPCMSREGSFRRRGRAGPAVPPRPCDGVPGSLRVANVSAPIGGRISIGSGRALHASASGKISLTYEQTRILEQRGKAGPSLDASRGLEDGEAGLLSAGRQRDFRLENLDRGATILRRRKWRL
jgi:hypothetical protein